MTNETTNDETILKQIALHRVASPTCGGGHGKLVQSATSYFKMEVLQETVPGPCPRWSVGARRKGSTRVEENPKKCADKRCGKELRPVAQQAGENGRDSMQCLLGAREAQIWARARTWFDIPLRACARSQVLFLHLHQNQSRAFVNVQ